MPSLYLLSLSPELNEVIIDNKIRGAIKINIIFVNIERMKYKILQGNGELIFAMNDIIKEIIIALRKIARQTGEFFISSKLELQ